MSKTRHHLTTWCEIAFSVVNVNPTFVQRVVNKLEKEGIRLADISTLDRTRELPRTLDVTVDKEAEGLRRKVRLDIGLNVVCDETAPIPKKKR